MNPFELRGPEFLAFYAVLFGLVLALGFVLRWFLRLPGGEPGPETLDLSPYEAAYLAGGEERVLHSTIAKLVHEDILAVDASERRLSLAEGALPDKAPELDRTICARAAGERGVRIDKLPEIAASALTAIRRRLEELGLCIDRDKQWATRALPVALVLIAPIIGFVKILVGISRHKPVEYLVIASILSVVGAFVLLGRPVLRSRRGDRALELLKDSNAAMESQTRRRIDGLAGNDLMLALGLFGMGMLASGPLAALATALKPPKKKGQVDWGWGASTWIGCGTSCSSCGSSCGGGGCGGGCGGGGCGGCGSG